MRVRAPMTPSSAPSWRRARPTMAILAIPPTPEMKKVGTPTERKPLTEPCAPVAWPAPTVA